MNAKYSGGHDGSWIVNEMPPWWWPTDGDEATEMVVRMGKRPNAGIVEEVLIEDGALIMSRRGKTVLFHVQTPGDVVIARDTYGEYGDENLDGDELWYGLELPPWRGKNVKVKEFNDGSDWNDVNNPNMFHMFVEPSASGREDEFRIAILKGNVTFIEWTVSSFEMSLGIIMMQDYLEWALQTEGFSRIPNLEATDDPSFFVTVRAESDWAEVCQHMMYVLALITRIVC